MRIQLELPENTAAKLRMLMEEVGIKTYSEFFGYALTGLDWMLKERRSGRIILSSDPDFNQFRELSMPILDAIQVVTPAQPVVSTPSPALSTRAGA
jgi:hypothetical protein